MKSIQKPSYLGTVGQAKYISAMAQIKGGYAQCHGHARKTVGKEIVGTRVGLVRIAGSEFVVINADLPTLPTDIRPHAICIVSQCNDTGALFLTKQ